MCPPTNTELIKTGRNGEFCRLSSPFRPILSKLRGCRGDTPDWMNAENQTDAAPLMNLPERTGRECFRLRLQGISHSNKPAIRLKAISGRKNSLRSDNILPLINAASQALTMTNTLPQSPSAFPPRLFRKVHQRGCISLIFCVHPTGSISPTITKFT